MVKTRRARRDPDKDASVIPVQLNDHIERRVKDYSMAAAGIGALALVSPASAAPATTTLNVTVPLNGHYQLNVAGHNILSFINNSSPGSKSFSFSAQVRAINSGQVIANRNTGQFAGFDAEVADLVPLNCGQVIPGGAVLFFGSNFSLASTYKSVDGANDAWNGFVGTGKLLGFSYGSGSNIHYGWVQINIVQNSNKSYSVTLVQDGYEQNATQSINAGQTATGSVCGGSAPPPPTVPIPNSLWLVSLGVAGLAGLETLRRLRKTA